MTGASESGCWGEAVDERNDYETPHPTNGFSEQNQQLTSGKACG